MICKRCLEDKPEDAFRAQRVVCRKCVNKQVSERQKANRESETARKNETRTRIRKRVHAYLSLTCCIDCGESDPVVLEFDHVSGEKYMTVSDMVRKTYSWEKIFAEIQKCEVRCANCHRRKTARDFKWYSSFLEEPDSTK